jgi:predicted transcriptional regulator
MPVKEIMQFGVITVSPEECVNRVLKHMTHRCVRLMPVLHDGAVIAAATDVH